MPFRYDLIGAIRQEDLSRFADGDPMDRNRQAAQQAGGGMYNADLCYRPTGAGTPNARMAPV